MQYNDPFGRRGRFGVQAPVAPAYNIEPPQTVAPLRQQQGQAAPLYSMANATAPVSGRYRRDQRRATEDIRNAGFLEARAQKAMAAPVSQGPAMQPTFPKSMGRPMGEVTPQAPLLPGQFSYGTEQIRERSQQIGRDLADGADPAVVAPVNMTGFAANGGKLNDPNQQWDAQNAAQAQWRQQQMASRGGVPLGVAMPDAGRLQAAAEAKRANAMMTVAPYMGNPSAPQSVGENLRGQRQFNDASPGMYDAQTNAVNTGSEFLGAQTGMVGAQTRNVDANTQAVQDGSANWQQEREELLGRMQQMQTQLDRYRQIEMRPKSTGKAAEEPSALDLEYTDLAERYAYSIKVGGDAGMMGDNEDAKWLKTRMDALKEAGAKLTKRSSSNKAATTQPASGDGNQYSFTNRETGQQAEGQQQPNDIAAKTASIKQAFDAGTLTREQAAAQLRALGYED